MRIKRQTWRAAAACATIATAFALALSAPASALAEEAGVIGPEGLYASDTVVGEQLTTSVSALRSTWQTAISKMTINGSSDIQGVQNTVGTRLGSQFPSYVYIDGKTGALAAKNSINIPGLVEGRDYQLIVYDVYDGDIIDGYGYCPIAVIYIKPLGEYAKKDENGFEAGYMGYNLGLRVKYTDGAKRSLICWRYDVSSGKMRLQKCKSAGAGYFGDTYYGWQKWGDGTWSLFNESNKNLGTVARSGWVKSGGYWYYMSPTTYRTVTGWQQIGGSWYHFGSSSVMHTGWQKLGSNWYYFYKSSGKMATGWLHLGSDYYYLNASGAMLVGWQQIGGTWYHFGSSGVMHTGWQKIGTKWYWFGSSGAMATGTQCIGGKYYTFDASGALQ